ncbi:type III-B CRISPR module RAMP protein Cmr4 [Alysiella filiformis]|uniref:CRISPR-associated protein Cmr4 n=1 Tax=Alysiella filiformis DSM 16848 TaxID=1120981 RepID=A0A286EDG5_9NEIS|nr:type III-B CRISPR module RAMP protein Cmr4 [Alysiella filiformis]QMT31180.1 type III-B CRISPR module RAMP protein Cmr4 [Alysiella filiformis]UBQ55825.1 type III-B CRISPR module RAMP protein Cmr4 [Alysiella filiformis DSM 16848]SOD68884.1 CRISPR-associated protein Cmr4 [Alysiella filiformis DSM 16848]
MKTRLFHLHALSALHVGTGQGVGAVDLPIARSRATNLPIVAGSAIKGVLRDEFENEKSPNKLKTSDIKTLFGASANDENQNAGAVAFGDAHLLLLPVRSFAGTVAYATCPFILKRYQRDLQNTGDDNIPKLPQPSKDAQTVSDSQILIDGNKIALEDLDMNAKVDKLAEEWAAKIAEAVYPDNQDNWRQELTQRFVILPDDVFSFLADTATEIRTRIKIDREKRIVDKGMLWTEENLPCETVLWGVFGVAVSRDRKNPKTADELNQLLPEKELHIQLGGKHTVGRGLCRLLIGQ